MDSASPITSAVAWLQGALLGSATSVVAVIAIAVFGILMFSGRIDWRRGARIVVGCFIVFGAPVIAAGLLGAAGAGPAEANAERFEPGMAPAASSPPPLPYEPSRQPRSICWTCGGD